MCYLLPARSPLCEKLGCRRKGTHALFDHDDHELGKFCRSCARAKLRDLQLEEVFMRQRERAERDATTRVHA
jgi:hypothetical protein